MTSTIAPAVVAARNRLDSIDLLRGLVMVLMLLDHTRDFTFEGALSSDPLDPATTTPWLYVTRWITHLCAPTFVLLAGLGSGLRRLRGAGPGDHARFLLTRGLWLIFLELTAVRLASWWNMDPAFFGHLQVIWAIGVSMVVMSALTFLPAPALLVIGITIVAGHNLLDGLRVPPWEGPGSAVPGAVETFWLFAHQGGFFPVGGFPGPVVWAQYPVLPWLGIMALGHGMTPLVTWSPAVRRRVLLAAAGAMVVAFAVLRGFNLYGDPHPWVPDPTMGATLMRVFNVEKYPPSLLYTLVTLAPMLVVLALTDGGRFDRGAGRVLVTFGRVPLFYYLLQWATAHLAGVIVTALHGGDLAPYFMNPLELFSLSPPPRIGGPLWVTYVCWVAGVALLYWPCRWFAGVKARRREWWLSYL